ncbi:MAG: hypothetical protein HYW65_02975 [Candidatus Liptonbacteria bacterium]|nr:hypothetical protein [Candidatus Liptonbacteria bacterium]
MQQRWEIHMLKSFLEFDPMKWTAETKKDVVKSPMVKKVVSFALGPNGTNIAQAAGRWHEEMGISAKAEIKLCDLPESAVRENLALHEDGALGVFWTCAVFKRLNEVFFDNPGTFPFFFQYDMLLDEMQLAAISRECSKIDNPASMTIATHVSPAPLVVELVAAHARVVDASSNAEAARKCEAGEVTACITTETARLMQHLVTLHRFGSPLMVFFGGITESGLALLTLADGR